MVLSWGSVRGRLIAPLSAAKADIRLDFYKF
jgi:hypothetical protein